MNKRLLPPLHEEKLKRMNLNKTVHRVALRHHLGPTSKKQEISLNELSSQYSLFSKSEDAGSVLERFR